MKMIWIAGVVFLTGIAVGVGARQQQDTKAANLSAIEKLHKADVAATLTQDPAALTLLWDEGGVNFGFGAAPVVGLKDMEAAYAKFRKDYPEFKVLKYDPVITDVQIVDGWAIEVGNTLASYRMSAKEAPMNVDAKGMRVLKKQADGSWKFAVVGLK